MCLSLRQVLESWLEGHPGVWLTLILDEASVKGAVPRTDGSHSVCHHHLAVSPKTPRQQEAGEIL